VRAKRFTLESADKEDSKRCQEFVESAEIAKEGRQGNNLPLFDLDDPAQVEVVIEEQLLGAAYLMLLYVDRSGVEIEERKLNWLSHDLNEAVLELDLVFNSREASPLVYFRVYCWH